MFTNAMMLIKLLYYINTPDCLIMSDS